MERRNNYLIQAAQAKQRFLCYDQASLIRKFHLEFDERYLYLTFFGLPYRLCRTSGDLESFRMGTWQDANSFEEVMTLLDLLCDSAPQRCVSGRWLSMQNFGLLFHQSLLEQQPDPFAFRIDRAPEAFCRACCAMGGRKLSGADISYAFEVFDGLPLAIQFWHGDDEFEPRLRYLWDENATQYLRYETMYYAVDLLKRHLDERM